MNWLSEQRKMLHISQEDLAHLLSEQGVEVSRGTISHWERGRYAVPLDEPTVRRALSNIFRVTIPELLHIAGYEVQEKYSGNAMRGAYIIDQLPTDKQNLALGILEQFLNK